MNENSGETPNPLNPSPEMEHDTGFVSEPDSQPVSEPTAPETVDEPQPVVDEVVETEVTTVEEPAVDSLASNISEVTDPTMRPMEQVPVVAEPPKKKKNGLLIGAIIFLFVAIACGVAAALVFLNMNKGDAVAAAIDKLLSGNAPANLAVDGTIDFNITDTESPFSKISIEIDAEGVASSKINHTEATVKADFRGGDESINLGLAETYGANGDLYIKIDGIINTLNAISTRQEILNSGQEEVAIPEECIDPETGETICDADMIELFQSESLDSSQANDLINGLAAFGAIGQMIDGQWIRISIDELTNSGLLQINNNGSMACLTELVSGADQNTNSLTSIYKENPFITSTSENISVASKNDPIYKVTINEEKFQNFVKATQNSDVIDKFYSCVGYENVNDSSEDATGEISKLPDIYVEVDKDHNFTRLYAESPITENCEEGTTCNAKTLGTATLDFSFSYPGNVNVPEPTDYKDLGELFQGLLNATGQTEITE